MVPEGSLPYSQQPSHLSLSWARSIQSMPPPPQSQFSKIHLHLWLYTLLTTPTSFGPLGVQYWRVLYTQRIVSAGDRNM
jgi:hypothetical protein